jgi:hypothetical protein
MLHASSQDSSHIQNNKLTTKFFSRVRLNGKAINNYELKRELRKAPEAWAYYKQYSRRLIIGSSLLVPSILFNSLGDKDRLLGKRNYGYKITSLLFGIGSLYFIISSNPPFKKAIRTYNNKKFIAY